MARKSLYVGGRDMATSDWFKDDAGTADDEGNCHCPGDGDTSTDTPAPDPTPTPTPTPEQPTDPTSGSSDDSPSGDSSSDPTDGSVPGPSDPMPDPTDPPAPNLPEPDPTLPPGGDAPQPLPPAPTNPAPTPSDAAMQGLSEAFLFTVQLLQSVASNLSQFPNKQQGPAQACVTFLNGFVGTASAAHNNTPTAGADSPGMQGLQ